VNPPFISYLYPHSISLYHIISHKSIKIHDIDMPVIYPLYPVLRLKGGGKSRKAATQAPPDKGLELEDSEAGPFHQLLGCLIINTKVDDHFSDKRPFNEQAPYFLRRLLGKPCWRKGFPSGAWVGVLARQHLPGGQPNFLLEDRATWELEGKLGAPAC
jgi:hypothetical protein